MATELLERWQDCKAVSGPILIIGDDCRLIAASLSERCFYADRVSDPARHGHMIVCDEDRLPFADASFSAIFSIGMMDSVNDVPGSLILARRCLKLGGVFLGAFLGVGSGQTLRSIIQHSPAEDAQRMRMHPQIDVRAAGDLLARAGFSRSVADMETINARYSSFDRLIADVRANSGGNALSSRSSLTRSNTAEWGQKFDAHKSDDDKVSETFCPVYMTGYAA